MSREVSQQTKAAVFLALQCALVNYREATRNDQLSASMQNHFAMVAENAKAALAELFSLGW